MEKIDGIKLRLDEYEQELKKNSTRELVISLASKIRHLRSLGASYEEIVERIKGDDPSIRLTVGTLRKYLSDAKKRMQQEAMQENASSQQEDEQQEDEPQEDELPQQEGELEQ